MSKFIKIAISVTFLLYLFSIRNFAYSRAIYAGIDKTNIIPEDRKNNVINDSLYSKIIILDNTINKVAFIIVDSQGIPQFLVSEIKKNIQQATKFPIENIVIASTHTHTGIIASASPENFSNKPLTSYQTFLIKKLTSSFIKAYQSLEPVEIAWGKFNKPQFAFNRRWITKINNINPFGGQDKVKTNPANNLKSQLLKPAGPIDPEISFIAIRKTDGTPIAILANYSLHYIGGIPKDVLSADYFGFFDAEINKLLHNNKINSNFIGIMTNGTSGDINNNDYSKSLPKDPYYQKMKLVASDIANNIFECYKKLSFKNWIPINIKEVNIELDKRKIENNLLKNLDQISKNKSNNFLFHQDENYYKTRIENYEKTFPNKIRIPLQVIQLGDIVINTIPFEVFAETGLELKRKSPFIHSFTIGLANGHWGYLPTPEQHKNGGYETWITVSRVEKKSSTQITKKIIQMQKKLFNKKYFVKT